MIARCWRLARPLKRLATFQPRWFCERKKIELTEEQWKRFQGMMKSLAVESETDVPAEKLFNTPEQELSFKLLQGKSTQDILNVLSAEQPDKLTPAMLFLVVYCYSKFGSPCDPTMLPHLQTVIRHADQLDDASLVKLYELLKEHHETMTALPELPPPRQLQPQLLLDFVYILCQLYSDHPKLEGWLELLNSENSSAAPNILLSVAALYPQNKNLQALASQLAESCDDQLQLGKMALCALQNDQTSLAKRIFARLTPDSTDPDLYVDLLCRLVDTNLNTELAKQMLQQLPRVDLSTCSLETYINVWTLLQKIDPSQRKELIGKLTDTSAYQNFELAELEVENGFTIFIMCAYYDIRDSSFLDMLSHYFLEHFVQLPADKIFYLHSAAQRLGTDNLSSALRSHLQTACDQLSPKCRKLYDALP